MVRRLFLQAILACRLLEITGGARSCIPAAYPAPAHNCGLPEAHQGLPQRCRRQPPAVGDASDRGDRSYARGAWRTAPHGARCPSRAPTALWRLPLPLYGHLPCLGLQEAADRGAVTMVTLPLLACRWRSFAWVPEVFWGRCLGPLYRRSAPYLRGMWGY